MAINFPNSPIVGNTYDYNGVRYTYQANGYWAVTTPGTVGIASGAEVIVGTDDAKYLTPKSMEDSDFWSARNDGPGSGLDADTIDGLHLSGLIQKGSPAVTTETHKISNSGPRITYFETDASAGNKVWSVGANNEFFRVDIRDDLEAFIESIVTLNRAGELRLGGNLVWTAGNDGPGSGLDADTVDGMHGASIVRTDEARSISVRHAIVGNAPGVYIEETDQGADLGKTIIVQGGGTLQVQAVNDSLAYLSTMMSVSRAGVLKAGGDEVWDQGNCPKDLVANGYQKLASGLIIQWGFTSGLVGTTRTITFPIAFPGICRSVQIQSTLASSNYVHTVNSKTASSFIMQNYGITADYYWMAIGY